MRRTRAIVLASVLAGAMAAPAFAAWGPIGTVEFSRRNNHDVEYAGIRGDAIALTARNSDVRCRSVTATFRNGRTREIFSGHLPMGRTVTVDLPGRDRNVEQVDFDCRPLDRRRAWVDVAADTGPYGSPYEGRDYGPADAFGDFLGGIVGRQ